MSEEIPEILKPVIEEGFDIHYAPIDGFIVVSNGTEHKKLEGWSEHHKLMELFIENKRSGKLELKDTVNYGHFIFHGHSGLVQIWTWKQST